LLLLYGAAINLLPQLKGSTEFHFELAQCDPYLRDLWLACLLQEDASDTSAIDVPADVLLRGGYSHSSFLRLNDLASDAYYNDYPEKGQSLIIVAAVLVMYGLRGRFAVKCGVICDAVLLFLVGVSLQQSVFPYWYGQRKVGNISHEYAVVPGTTYRTLRSGDTTTPVAYCRYPDYPSGRRLVLFADGHREPRWEEPQPSAADTDGEGVAAP
jgi:hypothetical protein